MLETFGLLTVETLPNDTADDDNVCVANEGGCTACDCMVLALDLFKCLPDPLGPHGYRSIASLDLRRDCRLR